MADTARDEVTRLIESVGRGDAGSAGALLEVVYGELRKMAAAAMARERPGQTLQPTALVHEAYLKLMGGVGGAGSTDREDTIGGTEGHDRRGAAGGTARFENRAHFFAAAGEAMRRILVDQARRRRALKRGGGLGRGAMPADVAAATMAESVDVLALNEALVRLEGEDSRMATIVKLRFFAEMTVDEVAAALELSRRTVLRDWIAAKAWLMEALGGESGPA